MKKSITLLLLLAFILTAYSQNENPLKYMYDERNVVSSLMDGTWKDMAKGDQLTYKKDISVLNLIPEKFHKKFKKLTIYHAGFMILSQRSGDVGKYPFLLTIDHGNPHVIYFRKRSGQPYGDSESYNIFIVRGETRAQDKLFIGDDNNERACSEFVRVK